MPTAWIKSLHCKTNTVDDVLYPSRSSYSDKKSLLSSVSCVSSSHAVHDAYTPKKPKPKPKPSPAQPLPSPAPAILLPARFPSLSELPPGHSSRRVVEIIFTSSWSPDAAFPGEIEMLFRVRNPARTVARFEEHRAAVRARSGPGDSRCAADGNEMMRFRCGAVVGDAAGVAWPAERVRTFSGSGGAHASGGGGGAGRRRAMLVCRVIAGRVRIESSSDAADSVSLGNGELVVFDPRAVLPCFLIIYKL
ncbi:uncharacterized protein LOC122024696 [Zingiber officinale]|uniref:Uncharacterized protein n=1 Tax=Zingiber officinale TaxID=94328 RepID=A0A8J5CFW0_ZINOF|nr:uncharacterized protein LOC122024696 [Zingiber officinale]KAG6474933.1 hypothetical protein ZIOFF_064149 [Zingiber officinale]